jgi:Zn-dependent metalloprotease
MRSIHRQSGLTAVSIIALLAIGAFFIMLALRLAPIYLENFKVASHLEKLAKDPSSKNMSEDEIITKLFKRFDLDDVENVSEEDLTIEPSDNGIVISIDYEVRTPTIGNVDIVVVFAESAEISR